MCDHNYDKMGAHEFIGTSTRAARAGQREPGIGGGNSNTLSVTQKVVSFFEASGTEKPGFE